MKYYRKFLMSLLALGFLFACKQLTAQLVNEQIIEKARHSTVRLITEELKREFKFDDGSLFTLKRPGGGLGSGFFVDHDKIATNIHCIAGKTKIRAKLVGTETFYDIEGVIASDPENDLVILKVASKGPKPLSLGNSDAVQMGEPIAVVGSPKGGTEGQVTLGKVYNRRDSDEWLRLKAKLHPGDSGGPVLSSKGVIGIAVQGGNTAYGSISHAIPSNTLKQLLKKNYAAKPLDLEKWQQKEPILAYAYHNLASNMSKTGKSNSENQQLFYQKAIELSDKAIKLYESPTFYRLQGRVYEELKEYQKAIDTYTECINLKSDYAIAHSDRGLVEWKRRHYEKAIANFQKVIEFIPDDVLSYMFMGSSKEALGRYDEAVDDFGKVIDELSPNNANAYYNRGSARYQWGKLEESLGRNVDAQNQYQAAEKDYNRALQLNPNKDISFRASHNLTLVKKALERLE